MIVTEAMSASDDEHRRFKGRMAAQAAFFRASGCPAAVMMQRGEYCFAFGEGIHNLFWLSNATPNDNEKRE